MNHHHPRSKAAAEEDTGRESVSEGAMVAKGGGDKGSFGVDERLTLLMIAVDGARGAMPTAALIASHTAHGRER